MACCSPPARSTNPWRSTSARANSPSGPRPSVGVVFSAAFEAPWTLVSGREPVGPDEVAVDVGGAVVGRVAVGSVADLELPTGRRDVRVVGIASLGAGAGAGAEGEATPALSDAHALFDPRAIGPLLGAEGRVDRITVLPGPGVDRDELAARIGPIVGSGIRVTATSDPNAVTQQAVATLDDGVQQGTRGFALLSAAVAVIVVANVFAVVLAPRTRELALLRLVGASAASSSAGCWARRSSSEPWPRRWASPWGSRSAPSPSVWCRRAARTSAPR